MADETKTGEEKTVKASGPKTVEITVKQQKGFDITIDRVSGAKRWRFTVALTDDTDTATVGYAATFAQATHAALQAINSMSDMLPDDDDDDDDDE